MIAMSETDPYYEDDATEIATVVRTFRQINENIKTLNENLDKSTRTLGALVKVEYAGELARLGKSVNDLVQKQAALVVFLGLWALPYRAETAVARMIMSENYWDAAWRMIEAHDPARLDTLSVLTWIDESPEEAKKHEACRDKAWESGEYQECTVLFEPRK